MDGRKHWWGGPLSRWSLTAALGAVLALLFGGAGAAPAPPAAADAGDLALVPGDAQGIVSVRLAEASKVDFVRKSLHWSEARTGARSELANSLRKELGLGAEDVERLTLVLHDLRNDSYWGVLATTRPHPGKALLGKLDFLAEETTHAGRTFYRDARAAPRRAMFFFNNRVIVFGDEAGVRACLDCLKGPRRPGPLDEALKLARARRHLVIGANPSAGSWAKARGPDVLPRGALTLSQEARATAVALHWTGPAGPEMTASYPNADRAKDGLVKLRAVEGMLVTVLPEMALWPFLEGRRARELGGALRPALDSARMRAVGGSVLVTCRVDLRGPGPVASK